MREFHLPPSDPRIQRMTLEQRNYCIANMNADNNEANGNANDGAFSDTTNDKEDWFKEPDSVFDPTKGLNKKGFKKSVIKAIGVQGVHDQLKAVQSLTNQARLRHNYRVSSGQRSEKVAMKGLLKKAQRYRKEGIDRSNELDKYFDKRKSGNKYGFDV